jgi:hypothetical protein
VRAARLAKPSLVLVVLALPLVLVVLARYCSSLAPTPTAGFDRAWPLPCCKTHISSVSDVSHVCCKCFIWMLQK